MMKIWKEICTPKLYMRVLLLFALCEVHEVTKYKTARNLVDLFYWPEGFCLDVIVVLSAFVLMIQIAWFFGGILAKQVKKDYQEIKEEYQNLMNELSEEILIAEGNRE